MLPKAITNHAAVFAILALALCAPLRAQQDAGESQAGGASTAQVSPDAVNDGQQPSASLASGIGGLPGPPASKRQRREAESAYLEGARKLDHDDPAGAQREFERAAQLNPGNGAYALAATVAQQHRVTELVRQVSQARQAGDEKKAQALLAEARTIDPDSPLVLEHAEPTMSMSASAAQPALAGQATAATSGGVSGDAPIADGSTEHSWRIVPNIAEPIHLTPAPGANSFDLAGDSTDVVRHVFQAYGLRVVIDDSVEHRNLRFNMENVTYGQAMDALGKMANVFLVPVDETTAIAAKNDEGVRNRLERQAEETIYLPGVPADQFNEIVLLLRGIFDRAKFNPQPTASAIVARAPEDEIGPLNQTVQSLMVPSGEVVVEVRLYEVDTSKMLNAGANIPTQFGIFNVDQAAAQLVSQNSALVQQAIAQGLVSSTASNFEIAAALIGSGLVKSTLLNSTIGVFGGGLTQTGITETGSLGINLGLNSGDARTLDDVQLRVRDRETATFREGTRYPITTSTYTVGLAGAGSLPANLNGATINGVSVASLLSQSTGTPTTIPQVSYENLGVTLDATPVVEKSGRISMKLELKIEALTGESANNIPVLNSRDFKSDMSIAEGQSAVLSSFVSSSEVAAMSGLPGLSELPGFQMPVTKNVQSQTTQLVVVVTPHVVRRRSNLVHGPLIPMPEESAE